MRLRGPAGVSLALHALLIVLALVHIGWTGPTQQWGDSGTGGEATTLTLKQGIPLPPSPVENPLANDSSTLNLPEKAPEPEKRIEPPPTSKAYEIEDKKRREKDWADLEKKRMLAELKGMPKQAANAIPGSGGRAGSELYKAAGNLASGGIGFGGDFGARFGWYVRTVQECLGQAWERARTDSGARADAKVHVAFEILRDGTIANEHVTATSSIPTTDRLALGAVQACSGRTDVGSDRHLPRLPSDFEGSKIPVEVSFDRKQ